MWLASPSASDYIISQNSVCKNNKERDQVDLPALYKNRSQTGRSFFIQPSTMRQQQDFLRFADETCLRARRLLAAGRIVPDIATEWRHRATEAVRLVSQNLQMPGMKIAIKRQLQAKLNLLTSVKEQVRTVSASVLVMNGPRPENNQRIQWDDVKSAFRTRTVSYTHLTLPTNREV